MKILNDDVKSILAIVVPSTFILEITSLVFLPHPSLDATMINFLSGLLGLHAGWAGMIVGYYFNSSASSAKKDEIIAASNPPAVLASAVETAAAAATVKRADEQPPPRTAGRV